jgi:hypothetical protein
LNMYPPYYPPFLWCERGCHYITLLTYSVFVLVTVGISADVNMSFQVTHI